MPWLNRKVSDKCLGKYKVLSWCEQNEILPLVSLILVTVVLTGVLLALSCTVLGILVEILVVALLLV